MIKSSNPALTSTVFRKAASLAGSSEVMTIDGTVNRCFILLALLVTAATITWGRFFDGASVMGYVVAGGGVGFVLALTLAFKKEWAPTIAPLYACCQGLFLGAISALFEQSYPGIVLQAVGLTFGTLFCLLGAYKSGMIKVTENFKLGLVAATGGLMLFYLVSFVLSLVGVPLTLFQGSGLISVGFSLVVVVIAALNLVMDFDFIENGADMGAPKYMEWYAAFGLMVTLIWLYVEIVRLLAKLQSRRE